MIQLEEDGHVDLAPGETIADNAIRYLLHRIQRDADLRWLFAHTEAYRRLCLAYAQLAHKDPNEIKTMFLTPPERLRDEEPRIPTLRARVRELEAQLEGRGNPEPHSLAHDAYQDVRAALDLCPTCANVPVDSINRCDFCKAILRAIS